MITEADKSFYQAEDLLRRGLINEAAGKLDTLISQFPDYGRAYSLLGSVYHQHFNDCITSENLYKKGIQLTPEYTPVYIWFASLLLLYERYPELIAILNKAIEIPGIEKDKVYEQFGKMNELQMKLEEAITYYKRAIYQCFINQDIERYETAINRCIKKRNY